MNINFVLIGEGTSDDGLIPHLERLCIEAGADEVIGVAPDLSRLSKPPGHALEDKIPVILQLEPQANLLLIHRDADSQSAGQRCDEIRRAMESFGTGKDYVAIVPVQETEAWLLLDEDAIRRVAGKPSGRDEMKLPSPARVEAVSSPKERLREALLVAAQVTGRRRERFVAAFSTHRRLLLHRLPVGGPLLQVSAWIALRTELEQAITRLRTAGEQPAAEIEHSTKRQ